MLRLALLLSIISLTWLRVFAQGPQPARQRIIQESWTLQQGAPEGIVTLAQTADGFLWLGGSSGLFHFDGRRFERFHAPFGEQLLSTNVYKVFAPPTGGLWIGYTFGGFSFLNNGRVKNYGGEIATSTGSIFAFAQDRDGIVLAATSNGLWRFRDSMWRHLGAEWNAPVGYTGDLAFDGTGILWVMAGKKLLYLKPGGEQFRVVDEDLKASGFTLDADGKAVTAPIAVRPQRKWGGNSDEALQVLPVLRSNSSQIVDRGNGIWVMPVSDAGPLPLPVMRIHAAQPLKDAPAEVNEGPSETYEVRTANHAALVDQEENVWFADRTGGLHRFFYTPLIKQELPSPLGSFAMVADDNGAVWIGSWHFPGLYRVVNGKTEVHHIPSSPLDTFHLSDGWAHAYRAADRTFWFGGGNGLWHLAHGNLSRIELPREIDASFMQAIAPDRTGGLWISFGRRGLYRWADGTWTPFGGRQDLPRIGVVTEFTDTLGRVWFGYTNNQLAVLDGDRVQIFGPSDGLRVGNITAIYGRGHEVWIGGERGLQQFDHGRFHNIVAVDPDWLLGISGIVETADGDLWTNSLSGIFHISRVEIIQALKDAAYQVKGEHLGSREGLPGFAEQVRPLPSAIQGSDGRLWFAGLRGVVWIDPTRLAHKAIPRPVNIGSVSVDDKNYEPVSGLTLPAHTSSVRINYAAVSLSDPGAIRFRYKLRETDTNWREVGSASPVTYRNLPPGPYHFSVGASDTNGLWSDKMATVDFIILPAWYQTAGFRVLCAGAFVLLLWALYQFRLRQIERQFHITLEARVAERTRIARELHDTLLQSFHGLMFRFQAARNMLPRRPEETIHALDGALIRAAQAIVESRNAIQALRSEPTPQVDLAQLLTAIAQEMSPEHTNDSLPTFGVIVEGEQQTLSPIFHDEVYRIVRELLRNAFQHALARQIEAEIRYDHDFFRLHIRDDGKGIDPAVLAKGARTGHWGLPGVRERAQRIGAQLDFLERSWSRHGN
jgi:signal transduction histidine kinase/ligand-binding sensor domain-containing protein